MRYRSTSFWVAAALIPFLGACGGEESGSVPAVPDAELTAEVPELDAVHEFMRPL